MFAGEVGIPRVLALLRRHGIKAIWFAPCHSLETLPAEIEAVVAAGHELGAHGYSHEKPSAMTPQQEEDVLARSIELSHEFSPPKDPSHPHTASTSIPNPIMMSFIAVPFLGNSDRARPVPGTTDYEPCTCRPNNRSCAELS